MKSFKRISLLVVILALGILASGAQSARAQPAGDLTPGKYTGSFFVSLKNIMVDRQSKGPFTTASDILYDVDIEGEITIESNIYEDRSENKYKAVSTTLVISYARAYYLFVYTVKSDQQNCHALGVLNVEPKFELERIYVMPPMGKGAVFTTPLKITNFTDPLYTRNYNGNVPNCEGPVAQEELQWELENSSQLISKFVFEVTDFTDKIIKGKIDIPGWKWKTSTPGGWAESMVERADWSVYRMETKPGGWKK